MARDLLFPQWCISCGKEGSLICYACRSKLTRIMPPLCPLCGRPQPYGILCPSCINWQAEIEGIRSPFRFDGIMRQAIHQPKYQNLRSLSPLLAQLLYDYLTANPVLAEVLVPVPLHHKRLRKCGYNQSGLLAKELGKLTGLEVMDDCLVRQRHTLPQARTAIVDERRSNITGAFICRDRRLPNKQVLLIDDFSTSGATLDAGAAELKATGAVSVWGLALAREI